MQKLLILFVSAALAMNCACATQSAMAGNYLKSAIAQQSDKLDTSNLDSSKPVIITLEDFDESSIDPLLETLEQLKSEGFKDLWIKIDSYGGSVHWGHKVAQAIEMYGSPVTCVVDTKAMSMGFYFLQSCDKRLMTKRSTLMAHEPSVSVDGKAGALEDEVKALKVMMDGFIEQCLLRMTISKAEFKQRTDGHDWYMGWEEAMKYKAIDGTILPKEIPSQYVKVQRKPSLLELLFGKKDQ